MKFVDICLQQRRIFSISTCVLKNDSSSNMWLKRQMRDPYVKKAAKESYRARSAFKLLEIDEKFKLINPGDTIIDIGASPGSWTQVSIKKTNSLGQIKDKPKGLVISVDKNYIDPLEGAHLLSYSDITDEKTIKKIREILQNQPVNGVISDMAPNSSGQKFLDHDMIISLQNIALNMAKTHLKNGGFFLCKIWDGDSTNEFTKTLMKNFSIVKPIKPPSSRSDSAEIFLLALKFLK